MHAYHHGGGRGGRAEEFLPQAVELLILCDAALLQIGVAAAQGSVRRDSKKQLKWPDVSAQSRPPPDHRNAQRIGRLCVHVERLPAAVQLGDEDDGTALARRQRGIRTALLAVQCRGERQAAVDRRGAADMRTHPQDCATSRDSSASALAGAESRAGSRAVLPILAQPTPSRETDGRGVSKKESNT